MSKYNITNNNPSGPQIFGDHAVINTTTIKQDGEVISESTVEIEPSEDEEGSEFNIVIEGGSGPMVFGKNGVATQHTTTTRNGTTTTTTKTVRSRPADKKAGKLIRLEDVEWTIRYDGVSVSSCGRFWANSFYIKDTGYWTGFISCNFPVTKSINSVAFTLDRAFSDAASALEDAKRSTIRFYNGSIIEQMTGKKSTRFLNLKDLAWESGRRGLISSGRCLWAQPEVYMGSRQWHCEVIYSIPFEERGETERFFMGDRVGPPSCKELVKLIVVRFYNGILVEQMQGDM